MSPGQTFQEYPGVALVRPEADGASYPGAVITIPGHDMFRPSPQEEGLALWSPYTALKVTNNDKELDGIGYVPLSVLHGDNGFELGSERRVGLKRQACLCRRINNWPGFGELTLLSLSSFLLLTALYGGLHCWAWNAHFPSSTDEVMWRASATTLLAGGIPAFLLIYLSRSDLHLYFGSPPGTYPEGGREEDILQPIVISRPRWHIFIHKVVILVRGRGFLDKEYRAAQRGDTAFLSINGAAYRLINALFQSTSVLCVALLLAARTFLLVECFIQLAHLPPGPVFTVPNWATYFPHLD